MKKTLLTVFLLLTSLCFGADPLVYHGKSDDLKVFRSQGTSDYYFKVKNRTFKIEAGIGDNIESSLRRLEGDLMFEFPKTYKDHLQGIKLAIANNLEEKTRFSPPTDKELLKKSESIQQEFTLTLDGDKDCAGDQIKPNSKDAYFKHMDIALDKESDKKIRGRIAEVKLAEQGFFNLGKIKGIKVSWDTKNDNFGHGLYSLVAGSKDYSDKPAFEGDDRGLTFGTSEGGTIIYENGELTIRHYSDAYTKIAPQSQKVKIDGKEYETEIKEYQDENGKWYQEVLNVEGLEIELRRDISTNQMYFKVAGRVEKLSDKGLASKLQHEWHNIKDDFVQYHNLPSSDFKDKDIFSVDMALGKDYERPINNWLGIKGNIEGRSSTSTMIKDNSYVSVDAELAINSNSWKRESAQGRPPVVEAAVYAGKKRYFDGKTYDRVGVRITGNILVSDNDVVAVYAGAGLEEDPYSVKIGEYEISQRGRVDVTHYYGINWTHYFDDE